VSLRLSIDIEARQWDHVETIVGAKVAFSTSTVQEGRGRQRKMAAKKMMRASNGKWPRNIIVIDSEDTWAQMGRALGVL
jgi:hypothetical protein